jgi:hypothetical protein
MRVRIAPSALFARRGKVPNVRPSAPPANRSTLLPCRSTCRRERSATKPRLDHSGSSPPTNAFSADRLGRRFETKWDFRVVDDYSPVPSPGGDDRVYAWARGTIDNSIERDGEAGAHVF